MKVFIVNLQKDTERRDYMLKQCQDLNIEAEIFTAYDGIVLTGMQVRHLIHPLYHYAMTRGEIGCSLSHFYIYRKMVDERIDRALILEDDVELAHELPKILSWYKSRNTKDSEVMLLSQVNQYFRTPYAQIDDTHRVVNVTEAVFTHSYMLNLRAAEKLCDFLFPIWLEADRWTFLREYGVIKLRAVVPPLGLHSELSNTSTIWVSPEELSKRREVEEDRSKVMKLLRKKRPLTVKLKNLFWRIFIRKLFAIERGRS